MVVGFLINVRSIFVVWSLFKNACFSGAVCILGWVAACFQSFTSTIRPQMSQNIMGQWTCLKNSSFLRPNHVMNAAQPSRDGLFLHLESINKSVLSLLERAVGSTAIFLLFWSCEVSLPLISLFVVASSHPSAESELVTMELHGQWVQQNCCGWCMRRKEFSWSDSVSFVETGVFLCGILEQ